MPMRLASSKRDIGRVIAVFARFGALDDVLGQFQVGGDFALAAQVEEGLRHQFTEMVFHWRKST